jgi:hypothetical protein
MMMGFLRRARPAAVVGAGLAILMAGVAAGAAGDPVIAGAVNSSGASQTTLLTTAGGASFTLKNTTNGQTGQFGWSSGLTGAGRGIYGRADSPDGFGVDAYNGATTSGGGAALRARADKNTAIEATASGCTGFFICGSHGVSGQGYGFGAGVFGNGTNSLAGLQGLAGTSGWALYAASVVANQEATLTTNTAGTGILAEGVGSIDTSAVCGSLYCFGAVGSADNGIAGFGGASNGVGVYGKATGATGVAVYANGDALVSGNLTVSGTCTGCSLSTLAMNGSSRSIAQGTAVTVTGVATAPDGTIVVVVDVAKGNDTIFGIADVSMAPAADRVNIARTQVVHKTKYGDVTSTSAARTVKNQLGNRLVVGGTSIKAGGYLRVVTSGVYAYKAAAPTAAVGDKLAVGATAGKLSKAGSSVATGATAGTYLGKLKDGRIVLLIAPN